MVVARIYCCCYQCLAMVKTEAQGGVFAVAVASEDVGPSFWSRRNNPYRIPGLDSRVEDGTLLPCTVVCGCNRSGGSGGVSGFSG